MALTIFQKLVLHALAVILWHHGEKLFARLLRGLALGHHTDSQKDSAFNEFWRTESQVKRLGLPGECHRCMKDFDND